MRAFVLLGAVVVALALPALANAKGLTTVRVCGVERCVTLGDRQQAATVTSPQDTVVEPPRPAAFHRLDIATEAGEYQDSYSALFVPSAGLIAADEGARRALIWYVPRTDALQQLRAAIRGLEAYEAPASWPNAVAATLGEEKTPQTSSPYVPWGVAVFLVLGGCALGAHRIRVRRPTTA
jgi:hypothetical protein